MVNFYGAYLQIPKIGGKIFLSPNESIFHIGREEIKNSATRPIDNPKAFNAISGARKDQIGNFIKEQFIISYEKGQYIIVDKNSSNGTYIGDYNLKNNPKKLEDGDKIIVPIEENGQLLSLDIYFYIAKKPNDTQINTNNRKDNKASSIKDNSQQAEYFDPQNISGQGPISNIRPQSPAGYGKSISQHQSSSSNAVYINPNQQTNTTGSFILVKKKVTIPTNAFAPNSGLDLSWIYKLEKSEGWHIGYAFMLLFFMVYHTYINLMIIQYIITKDFNAITFFVDPIPIAIIFGLSFIVHELSHLNMGRKCGYQSRFCLTDVGVKTTKKSVYIGVPFGLPGAAVSVGIDPDKDKHNMGKIKVAGPTSNLILGVIFISIVLLIPSDSLISLKFKQYLSQGASLNFILGAFNLIPIKVKGFALDGENIIKWNKKIYIVLGILFIIGIISATALSGSITQELVNYPY